MDLLQHPAIIFFILILFSLTFLVIISNWKLYEKAGQPGWASIIPVYNFAILLEIVGKPAWWIILSFIPVVNFIVYFTVLNGLAKSFGKNMGFTIGLILLPFVFFPILAFGESKYNQPTLEQSKKIKKRSNLLLIILVLLLLTILGFIVYHYLRIYTGCPYNNSKIHYSFNTGCSLTEESFPFDACSYNGTCKSFVSPGTGSFAITATPITEVISAQYANIKERATPLELNDLFGNIGNVNQYSIGFTYYFRNTKLIEKIQPLHNNDSIYKEVEITPFLTNKNRVNFYRFMNRYCAAGNSYSVCFVKNDKITVGSENEMKKLLNTFKFN